MLRTGNKSARLFRDLGGGKGSPRLLEEALSDLPGKVHQECIANRSALIVFQQ